MIHVRLYSMIYFVQHAVITSLDIYNTQSATSISDLKYHISGRDKIHICNRSFLLRVLN